MILFQSVSLAVLLIILLFDVRGLVARRGRPFIRLGRMIIYMLAGMLILMPSLTTFIATQLGIGRGTDLILYLTVLIAPYAWFRIQGQHWMLEQRLVELARAEAMRAPLKEGGNAAFDSKN